MLVVCKANSGRALEPASITAGNFETSRFDITIGTKYVVAGLILWKSTLNVLLCDNHNLPNTYPIELFEIEDGSMPSWWRFGRFKDEKFQAVFGYEQLLDMHYWDLLIGQRDKAAVDAFRLEIQRLLAAQAS
jgi:hypothetical protein